MGASSSKLSPDTACKLQAATHFDKKEINTLYANFVKDCPSGRMSRDDLTRIYRQFFPFGDPTHFVNRLITIFSTSGSLGREAGIEFADFIAALSVISRGRLDEKLYWSFKFCDINADGWISKEDLITSSELIFTLIGNVSSFFTINEHKRTDNPSSTHTYTDNTNSYNDNNQCSEQQQHTTNNDNNGNMNTITDSLLALENRINDIFDQMDESRRGVVDFNDFKRVILNDSEIIQGFLLYDGVI